MTAHPDGRDGMLGPTGIAIVTDSTACLPTTANATHGITTVPLTVLVDHDVYVEGVDHPAGELRLALTHPGEASTSRPSPHAFLSTYDDLARRGATAIVSIHLSATLSGTVDAARIAARDAQIPVHVVDSRSMAMGLGYAVLAAAHQRAAGGDIHDIAHTARDVGSRASVFFCVSSLDFLRRGGRIGAASALLGSALAVKPLLALVDGQVVPVEKQRTMARAAARLVDLVGESGPLADPAAGGSAEVHVAVQHVDAADRAQALADALSARWAPRLAGPVQVVPIGLVGATHLGPGCLGVVVAPALRGVGE
ncbi:DegV family protein [Austwickia sp. TVS 96-490-7B]|uniref:DegV family protein n=1 Tax=Austwickia sp. TVS 96-490-7B TaxID=2830843 RepID=UPI00210680D8|nr:DegV family protein [Austwickia sp. TVS 96-490-7B]